MLGGGFLMGLLIVAVLLLRDRRAARRAPAVGRLGVSSGPQGELERRLILAYTLGEVVDLSWQGPAGHMPLFALVDRSGNVLASHTDRDELELERKLLLESRRARQLGGAFPPMADQRIVRRVLA